MCAPLLKRQLRRRAFCSILHAFSLLPVLLLTHASVAADASWTGGTGTQLWSTGTNWSPTSAPGATSGTTNSDTATFNTAAGATTITIDAGRNLLNLPVSYTHLDVYKRQTHDHAGTVRRSLWKLARRMTSAPSPGLPLIDVHGHASIIVSHAVP